jgi:phosphoserine aminotransferase
MNIPFFIEDVDLQTKFLKQAQEKNLYGLKGHSSIGGIRASIYNAMEEESVERLIDFMNEFNKKYT